MVSKDTREVLTLVVALVVSLPAVSIVASAGNVLWEPARSGALRQLISLVPLVGLDPPVTFIAGAVTAWVVLFLIDGTKRVQALLVVVILVTQFIPFLSAQGVIIPAIGRAPVPYAVGILLGLIFGVFSTRLYDVPRIQTPDRWEYIKRWTQFPAATGALLYLFATLIVITGVDYITSDFAAQSKLLTGVSTIVLIVTAFIFFRFNYQRRVAVISPSNTDRWKYHPYIIGGAYNAVSELGHNRQARQINGDLTRTIGAADFDALDSELITGETSFGFEASLFDQHIDKTILPSFLRRIFDFWFLRPIVVESQGWTTSHFSGEIDVGQDSLRRRIRVRLWQTIQAVVPVWLRERIIYKQGNVVNRLDHADIVLLAAPTLLDDESPPNGMNTLSELLARYSHSPTTEVSLVLTRAARTGWSAPNSNVNKSKAAQRLGIKTGPGGNISLDDIVLVNRWPMLGFTRYNITREAQEDRGLLSRMYR